MGLPVDSPPGRYRGNIRVLEIWDCKERNDVEVVKLHHHERGSLKNPVCRSGHRLKDHCIYGQWNLIGNEGTIATILSWILAEHVEERVQPWSIILIPRSSPNKPPNQSRPRTAQHSMLGGATNWTGHRQVHTLRLNRVPDHLSKKEVHSWIDGQPPDPDYYNSHIRRYTAQIREDALENLGITRVTAHPQILTAVTQNHDSKNSIRQLAFKKSSNLLNSKLIPLESGYLLHKRMTGLLLWYQSLDCTFSYFESCANRGRKDFALFWEEYTRFKSSAKYNLMINVRTKDTTRVLWSLFSERLVVPTRVRTLKMLFFGIGSWTVLQSGRWKPNGMRSKVTF